MSLARATAALIGAALVLLALALAPRAVFAAWPTDPSVNVVVSAAAGIQAFRGACTDGAGGMFIAWGDTRTGSGDIYAQHMDAQGAALWTPGGKLVCGATGDQDQPVLVPDGTGGILVAWRDFRNSVTGDIYAQRMDAAGTRKWGLNGVPVCSTAGEQAFPVIVSDMRTRVPGPLGPANPYGAIIAWEDWRDDISIHAQRVNADGEMLWLADGLSLSLDPAPQFDPDLVSDGSGGAFAVWSQQGGDSYEVGGQHVENGGTLVWGVNGRIVNSAPGAQVHPVAVRDSSDGVIVVWEDHRGADSDIYAQRLSYFGSTRWPLAGVPICAMAGDQWQPMIASDGAGGVLTAWTDQRAGDDIYAQRTLGSGAPAWTVGGVGVCTAANVQQFPSIVGDGHQGAMLAWEDYRPGTVADIYSQRIDGTGTPRWTPNGEVVSNAVGNQYGTAIVADGDTLGIVVWTDQRAGGNDLYAQSVPFVITLGVESAPPPGRTRIAAAPNPSFGPVTLSFALAAPADVDLAVYDAAGRRVRTLLRGARAGGEHAARWDARDDDGRACSPGAYWVRLRVDGETAGSGALTLRR
ncbi:MAG: hypothetical protein IT348_09180 [Candidatus Eisenbacteria bacterium]|nr:hypothetical protein [Candidatus Eisenbacteria bacterium]